MVMNLGFLTLNLNFFDIDEKNLWDKIVKIILLYSWNG